MVKMCCASLHLLIGVALVLNVVAEEPTNNTSSENKTETTPASVFMFPNATEFNHTNDLPSTTVKMTTSPESDSPTPPVSEHPQTRQEHTPMMSTKASIKGKTQITTIYKSTPAQEEEQVKSNSGSTVYVIILVIIIGCLIGGTTYCCLQKNSRRYSVDLHPKKEDAQIPLSAVDAEVFDSISVKDMQTFSVVESSMPIQDPEPVKEAEKPDGEKETADVKEKQSNTQAIVIPEDKAEELTIVDLTDGEMAISTKTSVESLDEPPNNNNNNNTGAEANDNGHEFTKISIANLH